MFDIKIRNYLNEIIIYNKNSKFISDFENDFKNHLILKIHN